MRMTTVSTLMAMTFLLVSHAAKADAQAEWSKVTSPDGRISIEMPCRRDLITIDRFGEGFWIQCVYRNTVFFITFGTTSSVIGVNTAENTIPSYEHFAEIAKIEKRNVHQYFISNRRAFYVSCSHGSDDYCTFVVDLIPGRPLVLGVGVESKAALTAEKSNDPLLAEVYPKFFESLELYDE